VQQVITDKWHNTVLLPKFLT